MQSEKLTRVSIVLIAGLAFGATTAAAGILPPYSSPFGQSYSGWSAQWWQWAYSLPVDEHPLFDTADCSTSQSGKVWFLGGTFDATADPSDPTVLVGEAERECVVKPGTALFFPIINVECDTFLFPGQTEAYLRACANDFADHIQDLLVTIDGVAVDHLGLYRTESALFTIGPFPVDNVPGAPVGSTAEAVGDGYYILLAPLPPGEHEIHFEGAAVFTLEDDGFDYTFIQDITYHLTVGR
jgi:hypothetical protein